MHIGKGVECVYLIGYLDVIVGQYVAVRGACLSNIDVCLETELGRPPKACEDTRIIREVSKTHKSDASPRSRAASFKEPSLVP